MFEKLGPNGPERLGSLPCDKLPVVAVEHLRVPEAKFMRRLVG